VLLDYQNCGLPRDCCVASCIVDSIFTFSVQIAQALVAKRRALQEWLSPSYATSAVATTHTLALLLDTFWSS